MAAGSLPDRSVGNVSGIRDPNDFSERPCVKDIQSPSKRLCDRYNIGLRVTAVVEVDRVAVGVVVAEVVVGVLLF